MRILPRLVTAAVAGPMLVCMFALRLHAVPCNQKIGSDSGACIDLSKGCARWNNELECVQHIGPKDSQDWNRKCEGQGGVFDHCTVQDVNCAKQAHCSFGEFGCDPGDLVEPEAWYQTPKAVLGGTCTSSGG